MSSLKDIDKLLLNEVWGAKQGQELQMKKINESKTAHKKIRKLKFVGQRNNNANNFQQKSFVSNADASFLFAYTDNFSKL